MAILQYFPCMELDGSNSAPFSFPRSVCLHTNDGFYFFFRLFLMKKLKEVTDKKKISLLKNIDEKLTEAARELGFSLEQRTAKMKQRDKKVRQSVGLCFPLWVLSQLHLIFSPPALS